MRRCWLTRKSELVYIATPHSHHLEHGKLCISCGKPVLCEKSFTANAAQARELLDYAAEKKGVYHRGYLDQVHALPEDDQ